MAVLALGMLIQSTPRVSHGVATGDVTPTSAIVWSRADGPGTMHVEVRQREGDPSPRVFEDAADPERHWTARVRLTNLTPDTPYAYDVWFENAAGRSETIAGRFRTAPESDSPDAVTFLWAGDLGGQGYCRREGRGYDVFRYMEMEEPAFLIANGDMIYADNTCPMAGPVEGWINIPGDFAGVGDADVDWEDSDQVEAVYADHWLYNRADPAFQSFLAGVPIVVQWDDHEVINDFGAPWEDYPPQGMREGFPNLVAAGRKTLFDFNPIERPADDPERIYRSFRWGRHLELFLLDARSYRSENTLEDSELNSKTMLGAEQLDWLIAGLTSSDATWKVVSTDVPLSAPTGGIAFGRDAFASGNGATGFERELVELVQALDAGNVTNLVFVATDVHYPAQLRYEMDFDGDGDTLRFHELISGPLSAVRANPPAFDPTLGPEVLYAEGDVFNYGVVRTGTDPETNRVYLRTEIRDEAGQLREGSQLELTAE